MKQLYYNLRAKDAGDPDSKAWLEEMTYWVEDNVTAEQHGREIVKRFNETLKPYEKPREFVDAIEPMTENFVKNPRAVNAPQPAKLMHQWEKTSLVTEKGGYDKMTCKVCGAKGKRFGMGQFGVKADRKTQEYCKGQKK
jgi:hypothetical protein